MAERKLFLNVFLSVCFHDTNAHTYRNLVIHRDNEDINNIIIFQLFCHWRSTTKTLKTFKLVHFTFFESRWRHQSKWPKQSLSFLSVIIQRIFKVSPIRKAARHLMELNLVLLKDDRHQWWLLNWGVHVMEQLQSTKGSSFTPSVSTA